MRQYTVKPAKRYTSDSESVGFVRDEMEESFYRTDFPLMAERKDIANLIAAKLDVELGDLQEDKNWTHNIGNNYFIELLEPGTNDVLCYLAVIDNMFGWYLVYLISNNQIYKTQTVKVKKK